ncbi:hypothetical protein QE385_003971 [Sphingomonas sp. SORGH_AS 950]|uniref:hypothetical protein n=1 Tax=Sphingomonas sp. SORGH_AS_0950 TaxID=3041792 RepID=UPI00278759C8|nr:hypothetical protein [Sphingomonas sp. SORGH_AS_0950]MDQ1159574.1 hypothetical protein [Sphingomonas sp. SORGH_AS_0950]
MLTFACGVPNGGSLSKPTFKVRVTGTSERQKPGRMQTVSSWSGDQRKQTLTDQPMPTARYGPLAACLHSGTESRKAADRMPPQKPPVGKAL